VARRKPSTLPIGQIVISDPQHEAIRWSLRQPGCHELRCHRNVKCSVLNGAVCSQVPVGALFRYFVSCRFLPMSTCTHCGRILSIVCTLSRQREPKSLRSRPIALALFRCYCIGVGGGALQMIDASALRSNRHSTVISSSLLTPPTAPGIHLLAGACRYC
jgi:hypothetical protein